MSRILWGSFLSRLEVRLTKSYKLLFSIIGPIFICIGLAIITSCAYTLFTVTLPYRLGDETLKIKEANGVYWWMHCLFATYLLVNILFYYYMAVATSPGKTAAVIWRADILEAALGGESVGGTDGDMDDEDFMSIMMPEERKGYPTCRKCNFPKPERAHHCSACNVCVLKMDHHCPWINNCVGHNNHRYFCLFLLYVPTGTFYFFLMNVGLFYKAFLKSENFPWPELSSMALFLFTFLLSVSLTLAVGGLAAWNLFLVLTGQTTIEYQNNKMNAIFAKSRGETFINEFDLGTRRNFIIFFNISPKYPLYTLFIPSIVPPVGDGTEYITASSMLSSTKGRWKNELDNLLPL
ncbi:DHHC palmitoyltransferase-domain-containing protein [Chytridium lagenaria]|nr:DHHC palmitoyltransferase-domain-containing protein [Chytridium lagenaria]